MRGTALGIFDFFRKSAPPPGKPAKKGETRGGATRPGVGAKPQPKVDKKVAAHAKVVADKRAQTYDRYDAIRALADLKSADAAAALLRRFTFSIDPSISDQEEKELAFQGIVDAGRVAKVSKKGKELKDEPTREALLKEARIRRKKVIRSVIEFCDKAEQLTWPLKVLRELMKDDEYARTLCTLLEQHDVEYARNVEPKVQIIVAMEDVTSDEVREAVERFLDDVNETVRFHAVQTTFAQGNEASIPALLRTLAAEESVRIKNKIAEGFIQRGFRVPEELRDQTSEHLRDTDGFAIRDDGTLEKRPKPFSFFD